jgi:thiosulfate/3-mercaptopyruvate sulfurtransferase
MTHDVHTLRDAYIVSADALAAELAQPNPPVLLDVRYDHDGSDGRAAYRAGHLPGAIYVDLPDDLSGQPGLNTGRRPLPALADLQRAARGWGLRSDAKVVLYDNRQGLSAGRGWWVLRWAGLTDVRLLDGGLGAWTASGRSLSTVVPEPAPGDVVLQGGGLPVLDADQAAALPGSGLLFDARGKPFYEGGKKGDDDVRGGHIPGALNLPTTGNLAADGTFLDAETLRQRFQAAGIDGERTVGVYCGGGVTAAHEILALASAGIKAALFPGSWSLWNNDPARPIATGPEPG